MSNIKKTIVILAIFMVIAFLFSGCGPGQPFEIESQHTPQSDTPVQVAAIR